MSALPEGWTEKPLGEVATLQRGFDLPVQNREAGQFPIFAANGQVGVHNLPKVKGPGVVTGRSGTLGKVHFVEGDFWPLNTALWVKDFHGNDERWVARLLQWLRLERHTRGTGVPTLNRNLVHLVPVLRPPLSEQHRIAAILDKADAIRRKRQEALALTDEFLRSAFVEMFGGSQSEDWPQEKIENLASDKPNAIRTGPFGSQLLHSEFVDEGIAVLGIDNVVQNFFSWTARRFITKEKYEALKRYRVFPDDVLITIMGTCGRCAIVPDDIPESINTKHLCCITLDRKRCLPVYLHACFLNHPKILRQLGISERGAVMPGLNMQIIKNLSVPLPPISLQQQFAAIVHSFERSKRQWQAGECQADQLFRSLQQRAFSGQL